MIEYHEPVVIEAENEEEALELAKDMDFEITSEDFYDENYSIEELWKNMKNKPINQ